MAKDRMKYFIDLAEDISKNNLGYRIGNNRERGAVENRGFLKLEDPAEYNRTAGDNIPNDI